MYAIMRFVWAVSVSAFEGHIETVRQVGRLSADCDRAAVVISRENTSFLTIIVRRIRHGTAAQSTNEMYEKRVDEPTTMEREAVERAKMEPLCFPWGYRNVPSSKGYISLAA